MRRLNILYCGQNNSELAVRTKGAVSMSGNKWSRSLLLSLNEIANVHVITHSVSRVWPKGPTPWESGNARYFEKDVPCETIGYPSLPFIADPYLATAYTHRARRLFNARTIHAVVCYNCMQLYHQAVMREARRANVPTFPIILDGPDPRIDDWKWIRKGTRDASGVIMLSDWMCRNSPLPVPVLHLDGGADRWNGGTKPREREPGAFRIVYTGALASWSGRDFLLKVIRTCRREDVRFVICGKVSRGEDDVFKSDPRVQLRGFVSEEELDEISRSADAFLNVRDPKCGDNVLNYPSKLPQYLSYGKPVISNALQSLSSDYNEVLDIDWSNTPDGFCKLIDAVVGRSAVERSERFGKIRAWFLSSRIWSVQARRLVGFIRSVREDANNE